MPVVFALLIAAFASAKDHAISLRILDRFGGKGKKSGADPATFASPCPPEYESRKGQTLFSAVDAKYIFLGKDKNPEPTKTKLDLLVFDRAPLKELGKNHFQIARRVFYIRSHPRTRKCGLRDIQRAEEENESGIDSRRQWASDHRDVYCAGSV